MALCAQGSNCLGEDLGLELTLPRSLTLLVALVSHRGHIPSCWWLHSLSRDAGVHKLPWRAGPGSISEHISLNEQFGAALAICLFILLS